MDADIVAWVRLVHVVLAAFWVGGDAYFFLLIVPNFRHMGPAAESFSLAILRRGGFSRILLPVSTTTVLAGAVLYYAHGYHLAPFADAGRGVLSLGAALAVLIFLTGFLYFLPRERRLVRLARAAGPPGMTPEQRQEFQAIGAEMDRPSKVAVTGLVLAFLLMVGRTVV